MVTIERKWLVMQGHLNRGPERTEKRLVVVSDGTGRLEHRVHVRVRAYFVRKEGLDHGCLVQSRRTERGGWKSLLPLSQAGFVGTLLQEGPLKLADVSLVFDQCLWRVFRVLIETTEKKGLVLQDQRWVGEALWCKAQSFIQGKFSNTLFHHHDNSIKTAANC